jgi:hypothetical protein
MKQKQANSENKPFERKCAALKSDYNEAASLSLNCTIIEQECYDRPKSTDPEHQKKIFPSGWNDYVRVDAVCQSRQEHPGGGLLRARRQYHASRCISPFHHSFTVSSRSVGLQFYTNTVALKANCGHTSEWVHWARAWIRIAM